MNRSAVQIPEVPNLIKRTRLVRINFISSIPNYRFQNNCHWKELSLELIFCEFKTDWRISSNSMKTNTSGLKHIFQDLRAQKIPSFAKNAVFKKSVLYSMLLRVTSLKRPWQGVALLMPSRVAYGQNYLSKIVYQLYFWQALQRNSGLWAVSTVCRRPPETFWPDMKLGQRRFLLKLKKKHMLLFQCWFITKPICFPILDVFDIGKYCGLANGHCFAISPPIAVKNLASYCAKAK